MGTLSQTEILELYRAIVSAGLTGSRGTFVAGLDPGFVASLRHSDVPGEQVLEDLQALNAAGEISDGTVPLVLWLDTAIALAGPKKEARVFEDVLRRVHERGSAGTSSPVVAPRKWILVAGTGDHPLPDQNWWVAERLGQALANASFGLITGGWSGVDACVALSFAAQLETLGRSPADRLVQFVTATKCEMIPGAKAVQVSKGLQEWVDALYGAHAVVLIGGVSIAGMGGTHETYQHAIGRRIPVFPIPRTSTHKYRAAQVAYDEMLSRWDTDSVFKKVTARDFRDLAVAIDLRGDADRAVNNVIRLLDLELSGP